MMPREGFCWEEIIGICTNGIYLDSDTSIGYFHVVFKRECSLMIIGIPRSTATPHVKPVALRLSLHVSTSHLTIVLRFVSFLPLFVLSLLFFHDVRFRCAYGAQQISDKGIPGLCSICPDTAPAKRGTQAKTAGGTRKKGTGAGN
jgi:hypothetical protein